MQENSGYSYVILSPTKKEKSGAKTLILFKVTQLYYLLKARNDFISLIILGFCKQMWSFRYVVHVRRKIAQASSTTLLSQPEVILLVP